MSEWPAVDSANACLILDFDGTLAPIVDDPATSEMSDHTRSLLVRLVGRLGRLAIVSGRPAGFLAERVRVDGATLVGLYGLEKVVDGEVVPDPRVEPYTQALDSARERLSEAVSRWPGAELEDKGRALAVHWRRAEERDEAGPALTEAVRESAGDLVVEDGKMVIELRPPVTADKGTAVAELAEGFSAVAYAGDDLGDLPAFAEVSGRSGLAVGVDHGPETDAKVRDAVDLLVDGTEGLEAWLADVCDAVKV